MIEKTENFSKIEAGALSTASLRIIASVSMLLDHIAYAFLEDTSAAYLILRCLGRAAVIIYAFLLSEGFMHTRSIRKYLLRLGVFAAISEPAFQLFKTGELHSVTFQNTMMTLFLSLVMLIVISMAEKRNRYLPFVAAGIASAIGWALKMDYGISLPLCVAVLYIFRDKHETRLLLACLIFVLEYNMHILYSTASIATVFAVSFLYNGQKGKSYKYAGYIFYPAHLLLLYLIKTLTI